MKTFDKWDSWAEAKEQLSSRLSLGTLDALDEAFTFATTCHGQQTRPNGDPYILHLLEVVEILVLGAQIFDKDILLVAVLHDILEDTTCSIDTLRVKFGSRVVNLVEWLTKPAPNKQENPLQVRQRYFLQLAKAPIDAIIVKLADRLSNVQRLNTHPRVEKQKMYYRETVQMIIPLSKNISWFDSQFQIWYEKFRYLNE